MVIVCKKLDDGYLAYVKTNPDHCTFGNTKSEAIGFLFISLCKILNVEFEEDE